MSEDTGLFLLKGDLYETAPTFIKESSDPAWVEFYTKFTQLRDEWVSKTSSDGNSLPIEYLDLLIRPDRVPSRYLYLLADMFKTRYSFDDTEEEVRSKVAGATAENRRHATVDQLGDLIEAITGTPPTFASRGEPVGWDEDNSINSPPYALDFQDGIVWTEDNSLDFDVPVFFWTDQLAGVLVDIKNDGAYTSDQLQAIYELVAELKNAELAADVGYVDSITGDAITLKVIYSTDLTQTSWGSNPDPGI